VSEQGAFRFRGIVEGYYGPPYSQADRLWWIERLSRFGMNLYVYAPKDDRLQREDWRVPYPDEEMRRFRELVARGADCGVDVGFSVSPGLSIEYSKGADVACLVDKVQRFRDIGSRFLSLGLDDVPSELVHEPDRSAFGCLATAHVALAHALAEALGSDSTLWLVPTDYMGVEPTAYLETLGAELDPAVEVGWTGRTVVSPTITESELAQRSRTLRRRLLLWDNYPVADGPMRPMLHLGPYLGRDVSLAQHASGVLLNPMQHAHASALSVATAADYLRDPRAYDPEASFRSACHDLGAGAEEAFFAFASAHRFSALAPHSRDPELEAAWRAHRTDDASLDELEALLSRRLTAGDVLRSDLRDQDLAREIEPWLRSHHRETRRMRDVLEFLRGLEGDRSRTQKMLSVFGLERKVRGRASAEAESYGPRRVLYPQLASLDEANARFGSDPALFLDRCLADELVRAAETRAARLFELVTDTGRRAP
jgi:hyaluronoglucosaminidase